MKRFLFVVPPFAGHVNPTISVARELEARGHTVAWVGHPRRVRPWLPERARLLALDDGASDDAFRQVLDRAKSVRGLARLQFLWEEVLVPLARGMLPGVLGAIRDEAPDVLVVDHQAIGGALAARLSGVPWATFCTTSASVVDPLSDLPKVKAWVCRQLATLQEEAGLPVLGDTDFSPERVIVFSTEELATRETPYPAQYRFVGPSISDRPDPTPFPYEALRDGPRLFVSLGTVSTELSAGFNATLVEALRGEPLQVILVANAGDVPEPPSNFIVRAHVPQLALLPHVHAVLCHAGHNTVCESLAHGLPLVVAPIRDDQPVIAGQVVRAGAGVRVKFGRLGAPTLRAAVQRALTDQELRLAARRLQASFASAGGAAKAAQLLQEMA